MRKEHAPPPGWYPDPTGGSQLWWWDGLDWTDHRRAPRTRSAMDDVVAAPVPSEAEDSSGRAGRMAAPSVPTMSRADRTEMIAEVRKVAREEVDRAVDRAADRARSATRDLQPLISEYGARVMKWIRTIGIVVIILLVLWMVLQTFGQASLLDWIGDRIDNLTGGGGALVGATAWIPAGSSRRRLGPPPGALAHRGQLLASSSSGTYR